MPQLTASLENAEQFATLPKTDPNNPPVSARVSAEKTEFSKKTQAPMICLQFQVDSGDYIGRELPGYGGWYYIMAGGKRESGEYHDLRRLFDTINALRAEWTCSSCGETTTDNFLKEKVKATYHYLCPKCSRRADVKLDGSWVGKECRLRLDVEKMQNSDIERNTIEAVLPR
jgi:hypothetical protein